MKVLSVLFAILVAAVVGKFAPGSIASSASDREPVLVELFTSQGCSSCPPADRLAEQLAREGGVVVISRPVTYWDRLGWKDTLAREENTRLQRAYAVRGLAGDNGVYTPQMVVDGRRGTVGSDEAVVRRMIRQEAAAPASIAVRKLEDGTLAVGVAGKAPSPAILRLLALKRHVTVRIAAGENGNRAIGYTNVVVADRKLSDWSGGKMGLHLTARQLSDQDADAYALILRIGESGPVLAARMIG